MDDVDERTTQRTNHWSLVLVSLDGENKRGGWTPGMSSTTRLLWGGEGRLPAVFADRGSPFPRRRRSREGPPAADGSGGHHEPATPDCVMAAAGRWPPERTPHAPRRLRRRRRRTAAAAGAAFAAGSANALLRRFGVAGSPQQPPPPPHLAAVAATTTCLRGGRPMLRVLRARGPTRGRPARFCRNPRAAVVRKLGRKDGGGGGGVGGGAAAAQKSLKGRRRWQTVRARARGTRPHGVFGLAA